MTGARESLSPSPERAILHLILATAEAITFRARQNFDIDGLIKSCNKSFLNNFFKLFSKTQKIIIKYHISTLMTLWNTYSWLILSIFSTSRLSLCVFVSSWYQNLRFASAARTTAFSLKASKGFTKGTKQPPVQARPAPKVSRPTCGFLINHNRKSDVAVQQQKRTRESKN